MKKQHQEQDRHQQQKKKPDRTAQKYQRLRGIGQEKLSQLENSQKKQRRIGQQKQFSHRAADRREANAFICLDRNRGFPIGTVNLKLTPVTDLFPPRFSAEIAKRLRFGIIQRIEHRTLRQICYGIRSLARLSSPVFPKQRSNLLKL